MSLNNSAIYRSLSDPHKRFVLKIISGFSQAQAYVEVFGNASNMSQPAIYKAASRMANTPKIRKILEREREAKSSRLEEAATKTTEALIAMATCDAGDVLDSNGKPRPINQLPEPLRTAVTKIVVSGDNYTYELGGKLKSMELLGKMTNLWKENQPVLMPISIAERDEKLIDIFTKALERNVPCPPGQTNRPSPFEDDE